MLNDILKKIFKKSRNIQFQVLDSILVHNNEYFSKYPRLTRFSKKAKEGIQTDLIKKINLIFKSQDKIIELRKILSDYVFQLAYFSVLSLTLEEKRELYQNQKNISGELSANLLNIAKNESELKEILDNSSTNNEELLEYCNTRRLLLTYYVNGLNILRLGLNDYCQIDWLHPFLISMCIWQEDLIRERSDMKRLLRSDLESLQYSSFLNIVEEGIDDPYKKWKSDFELDL